MTLRKRFTLGVLAAAVTALSAPLAHAQSGSKIKVGLMLPAGGVFAPLGNAIENGFRLHVQENGGKLAGESATLRTDPALATYLGV
jgi:branched-chain amino acid transport system substrate-binding protein